MTLSKLAEGLREMYLNSNLPADPYRCNAFTPRIILTHLEQKLVKKYSMSDAVYVYLSSPTFLQHFVHYIYFVSGITNYCIINL